MKSFWMQSLWILFTHGIVTGLPAEDAPKPIKIALIGDSTVASYAKPPADRPDLTGWGQVFGEQFTDRVTVLNHAASGRSSKSFRRENRWQPVLDAKPDYVFIQFGHNDQKKEGDRYADPETDFRDQMKQYIAEARAIGATPVLVTPVARRTFSEGKATTTLTPYADAMHAVGTETRTPVIDLHKVSVALYQKLGDEASADLTFGNADRTHFTHKGAVTMAKFVADGVREKIPELREYLKSINATRVSTHDEDAIIKKLRTLDSSAVYGPPDSRTIQLWGIEGKSLDDFCPLIADLSGVWRIKLSASAVSSVGMKALAPMKGVLDLNIDQTGLKGRDLEYLADWQELLELDCGPFDDGNEALKHIGKLTNLRRLSIHGMKFTPDGLRAISGLKKLEKLDLFDCEDVPSLSAIGELKSLKSLDFFMCHFSDRAIVSIPPLPELTFMGVAYCRVTDDVMPELEKHPRLNDADLRYTELSNAGFARLRNPERWKDLSLHELKIDDRALPSFAKMVNLEELDIEETDISKEGARWLETQLPKCRIDWEPRKAK